MTRIEIIATLTRKLNNASKMMNEALDNQDREAARKFCSVWYGLQGEIDGIKGRACDAVANDYLASYEAGFALGAMRRPTLQQ